MKVKQLLSAIFLISIICACNHRNDDIGWKLNLPEEIEKNEIISDESIRFVSEHVKMDYNKGGILVKKEKNTISFINISTGEEVCYSFGDKDYTDNPELTINGRKIEVKKCEILQQDNHGLWMKIKTADDEILLVLTNLR